MAAIDTQVGGDHYKTMGVQPWDVLDTWPLEQQVGAYRHGILKYTMRCGGKDERLQEIRKAAHYAQRLVEVLEMAQREAEIKAEVEAGPVDLDENAGDELDRFVFQYEQLKAQQEQELQERIQATWSARTQPGYEKKDGPQPDCFTHYPHRSALVQAERSCGVCMWEGQCADRTPDPVDIPSMPGSVIMVAPDHLG